MAHCCDGLTGCNDPPVTGEAVLTCDQMWLDAEDEVRQEALGLQFLERESPKGLIETKEPDEVGLQSDLS